MNLESHRAMLVNIALFMRANNIVEIFATYSGQGDSGYCDDISAYDASRVYVSNIDSDVRGELEDFVWDIGYGLHPGFEINDGGGGTVTITLDGNAINVVCNHYYNLTEETPEWSQSFPLPALDDAT